MEFVRFWAKVLRVGFIHSLDLAQAVLFVVLLVGGAIPYFAPSMAVNAGAWELAAVVFGGIVLTRLLFAPYWLWKEAHDGGEQAKAKLKRRLEDVERELTAL